MQIHRVAVLVAWSLVIGCSAKQAGEGAAKGALNEANKPRPQGPPPAEETAKNLVRGALNELDRPERQEQLARIIAAMTQGALGSAAGTSSGNTQPGWGGGPPPSGASPATRSYSLDALPVVALGDRFSQGFMLGLSRQLQSELGESGDGPLAKSLAAATEQMSGAAATGVAQGMAPDLGDCNGVDRSRCTEQRVQELSRYAAVGFAQGMGNALRIPLLIIAFLAGILAALVLFLLRRVAQLRVRA